MKCLEFATNMMWAEVATNELSALIEIQATTQGYDL